MLENKGSRIEYIKQNQNSKGSIALNFAKEWLK
jgi:hypothetical protein